MTFLSQLKGKKFLSRVVPPTAGRPLTEQIRFRPDIETLEDRVLMAATVVNVNATANVHAISPLIYGASFATTAQIQDLNLTINRDGGNAADTYNYQADATNHGSDWYYESIASGSGNGQGMDQFVSQSKAGGAAPDLTLDIMPYAANLNSTRNPLGSYPTSVYGAQQSTDPWWPSFGNGVTSGGQNITDTNPLYNYINNSPSFEQGWIQHLISTFGNSQNGGVQYYTFGNEPALWNSTHRDIHPNPETNTELINDIISYGSMLKSIDPNAQILGPEEWGFMAEYTDGAGNTGPNGVPVQVALLQAMQQYQQQHGVRLLDYFTNHLYPQASNVFSSATDQSTELLRNQTTRDFWDPNYLDPSWIGQNKIDGGIIDLIPRMEQWVNTYYPGTKTGVTEYNWGADGDMNGATAQADIYGIFGAQGLDLGERWGTPATGSPTYLAMKLWRNYDGNDNGFGNTSVSASVANPDQVDSFAATRSSDGALTVAVINKNLLSSGASTTITINLSNFNNNGVAQVWQLAGVNGSTTNAAITHLSDIHFSGNTLTVTVPNESVTMFVIEPGSSTAAPSITTQPQSTTIFSGQTATLSVAATGTGLTYQWYSGASGTTTNPISGATTNTLTTSALTSTTSYWVKVSNAGGSVNSNTATVTVNPAPSITTQPLSTTIFSGQTVTLSVAASGSGLTYQWYIGTSGTTTNAVSGATSSNFTTAALTTTTSYWVKVSNPAGSVNSSTATVTVNPAPSITAQPQSTTIFSGQTATLSVTASGTGLSYQWYIGASGTTTNAISGATGTSLTTPILTATTSYWVRVSNAAGSANSNTATVTVNPVPSIVSQPASTTITAGQSATLSVTATGVGLSYQWYNGTSGATTNPISGATSSSLNTGALSSTTSYWVKVSNGAGSVNSSTATVTVTPVATAPGITTQPASQSVNAGQAVTFSVTATGTGPLAYQWQKQVNGSWSNVGTNSASFTIASAVASDAGMYRVTVSNSAGSVTSNSVTLTVSTLATLPSPWQDADIGGPGVAGSASFSNGTFTVNGGGADIWNTSDQFNYAYQAVSGNETIIARVASQQNTDPWAKGGVMVRDSLNANGAYAFVHTTPGNGTDFQFRTADGASAQWNGQVSAAAPEWVKLVINGGTVTGYTSPDGSTWTQIGSTTLPLGSTYYVGLADTAHNNSVVSTDTFTNVSVASAAVAPTITTQPANQTATAGQSASFSVVASGTGPLTYQWQKSVNGTWTNVGANAATFSISSTASSDAGSYRVLVSNSAGSVTSGTATLTVNAVVSGGIAIDAGGGAAGSFVADTDVSGGSTYQNTDAINTSKVTNPAPQAVYDSERYGNFTYTVGNLLPNGSYTVRLHFAEIYWNSAGSRVFNVSINGTQVLSNFDIFATAGGKDIAIVEPFTTLANSSGQIVIQFTTVKDNAKVSGIEIIPNQRVSIDAGGPAVGSFAADEFFSGGTASSTTAAITTSLVTNPAPQSVYQTERYGNFTYNVAGLTPNAVYTVQLDFAEIYWTAAGQREFNVTINGTQVLTNFDIFAAAGGQNIAISRTFTATANSAGQITLGFVSVINYAKVSGIEIY